MKTMVKRWNGSKKGSLLIYGMIFLSLLICNVLSPYVVDDFSYRLSFVTKESLTAVWEIFPSMYAHAYSMNGRLSAHALVQLFSLMPPIVFDLVNSGVFCLLIWLISNFASTRTNNLLTLSIFCAIWLYEPVFGQVNLWQDGAVNYLWSAVLCLLYIKPFSRLYTEGVFLRGKIFTQVGFLVFSLLVGSYSETASAAAIVVSVMYVLLSTWEKKQINKCAVIAIVLVVVGYISIYLAPAQWENKSAEMNIMSIMANLINATYKYCSFGVLPAVALVLFIINLFQNTSCKNMVLGLVLIAGSLIANYIMIMASYYPDRSAVGAFVLLVTVLVVWMQPILENQQWRIIAVSAMAVLVLSTVPALLTGAKDIALTYLEISKNEQLIIENRENGILNVKVPMIYPKTEYSVLYNMKYLDTEDATSWPNTTMAKYYDVETIIGIK